MKTTFTNVVVNCDAPDCESCVTAMSHIAPSGSFGGPEHVLVPLASLPDGWRERRTALGAQHACSAACERALIDAETSSP